MRDILNARSKIEAITATTSEEIFLSDEVLPAAVLHHLTVIGEAITADRLLCSGTSSGVNLRLDPIARR